MKKIVRLTESDLARIVKRVINEQGQSDPTGCFKAAFEIENMDIEIIPTSYLLIDGGKKTSVEYVSQTTPIPNDQADIARKIALAGKFQGKKITYLDCGSGANQTVAVKMIQQVKSIGLPLIVGGGIRTI
jgi:putative glycerol-1-phosphate prenyltransferase